MKLSRRLVAGLSLAAAAILVPATALAASSGTLLTDRVASAPTCGYSQIQVWTAAQADSAMMHSRWQVEISNIGSTTCSLYGYPGVSALDYHGHMAGKPATHSGGRFLATLAPGGTAHFVLVTVQPGAQCPSSTPLHGVELRVYAPGQFSAHLVPFDVQVCPSVPSMSVDSVHPGTGIPYYSNS